MDSRMDTDSSELLEISREMSPRLHSNVTVSNANESLSFQDNPVIDIESSQEQPSVQGIICPKIVESSRKELLADSATLTLKVLDKDSSGSYKRGTEGELRRRMSPRLHRNPEDSNACASFSNQKRFSPHHHQDFPVIEIESSALSSKSIESFKKEVQSVYSATSTMEVLDRDSLGFPKCGMNGEFRRKSPRLNSNVEDSNGHKSLSYQRRFGPRRHQNFPDIDIHSSVEQTSVQGTLCSKILDSFRKQLSADYTISPQKVMARDLNFARRMSPRLHGDRESEKLQNVCNNSSEKLQVISVGQAKRRFSPRLHSNLVSNEQLKTTRSIDVERRLSPRLHPEQQRVKMKIETQLQKLLSPRRIHCGQENEKILVKTPLQRRLSPRLHNEQKNDNQETPLNAPVGAKRPLNGSHADNSYVNETTCAFHDDAPRHLASNIIVWANKALKQGEAASDRGRVKEALRIFNAYYLQYVQVEFVRGCPLKTVSEMTGLVCRDISNGVEEFCVPVTNLIDDPPVCPPGFTYIKSREVSDRVNLPPKAIGCSCKGICTNPNTCECAKLNGSDFPYVRRNGGRLVEAKDVVFECGPNCGCRPGCLNRVSQRGIKYRLEVYRTPNKGWAVRSWDFIPSGAPVCEYIGVVRRSDELDDNAGNEYVFEIDCLHTINEIEGRERRFGNVPVSSTIVSPKINKKILDREPEFCIDAGSRGNLARFINHSCEPNLFVQCILSGHRDLRLARLVLIAADDISPLQELTYDYGFALNSVVGPDGKIKKLPCFCGTPECRKRLY
ncbi:uncharacterized protein LOC130820923 [Amaranthus tricolor]|uniref:uncharacterized protein LOC130820923 n=1 Tax=Amaranthus tricolor TaxID=29722 RepID=UPI00258CF800|nr:uncharacterized protein LOC130820923 [Amaranthus tricolor]XP_057542458.1 uncharacterized protein LOC130820923 [Amaranthus tricolor]